MLIRSLRLLIGLFLYGIACALMIVAGVGVDPWTVFAQGWDRYTGLGMGWLTFIISAGVMLIWIPLRQRPGVGTILNIVLVPLSMELGLWLIPHPEELWLRILVFAAGLLLLAVASGLYIGARMGPGPRDGLMMGIHTRTGWPLWVGRTIVEVTVLGTGWLMGGNVGAGTVAFALLIGPLCSRTIPLLRVRESVPEEGMAAPADPEVGERPEDTSSITIPAR
ncbi:membrane protein [Klugiella xanthotipulae]|uniref:Putative membrane protein YczE n=1 Tax=Klugiella xanthotipulae TaxID=244735 RepID=A0A543I460_9MICO|nr:hypothetical protein [Klugiella xanthotipulae]TQM65347.1 putative membrane protein YczE [Klugiella xanthotipulae]